MHRKHFYTQKLLHTDAFTHKSFYTQKLLHTAAFTHKSFHIQKLLQTDTFTHRPFYTQTLVHTDGFTHRHFYTQTLLHRRFYTQSFYPQKLLQTEAFTHRRFYTDAFTHRHSYTQTLLHTDTFNKDFFTHRSFYTQKRLHANTFTHKSFYTQKLLHIDTFSHRNFYTHALLHTITFTQTYVFTHRSFYTQTLLHIGRSMFSQQSHRRRGHLSNPTGGWIKWSDSKPACINMSWGLCALGPPNQGGLPSPPKKYKRADLAGGERFWAGTSTVMSRWLSQWCPGTTICAKGIGSFIDLRWSVRPFCLTHADALRWDRMHYGEPECLKQRCVHQQVSDSSGWLMLMHFIVKFNAQTVLVAIQESKLNIK